MRLDFVRRRAPSHAAARLFALAAAGVLALAAARWYDADEALRLAAAQSPQPKALPRATSANAAEVAERIRALNGHIRALNFPWGAVMKAVQPPGALGISVLRLELDAAQSSVLRVAAQTAEPAAMAEYVVFLRDGRGFSGAFLRRHERLKEEAGEPYRFEIEASWTGAR